jgi:hypothetical protein
MCMTKIDRFLLDKFYILCILVQLFLDGCTHEQLNFLVEKLKRLAFEKENLSKKTCQEKLARLCGAYYRL